MNFIDLSVQQRRIKQEIDTAIQKVLRHGQYIMGPEVRELEEELAAYVGVRHAVGCASGTDALLMALMVWDVGPGDAIFTTPFTFFATAEVISILGATPVFVDIDPVTFNIDPGQLERAIIALNAGDAAIYPLPSGNEASGAYISSSPALVPRGVIPVDLFGLPADYDAIAAIAGKHGLFVIEDAAQSFGGEYKGRRACSFGDIACTSFFPAKPLGGYGDGGMCFTDDDEIAKLLQSLRVHGQGDDKYENVRIGINGRLDTLQAAILKAKFAIFPEEVELRREVAARYAYLLSNSGDMNIIADAAAGIRERAAGRGENKFSLSLPCVPPGCKSIWAQYSVLASDGERRAEYQASLKEAGVPTAIYYPRPLHLQSAFASLNYCSGDFPCSEATARRIFSLPMHPYLLKEEQAFICSVMFEDGKSRSF